MGGGGGGAERKLKGVELESKNLVKEETKSAIGRNDEGRTYGTPDRHSDTQSRRFI